MQFYLLTSKFDYHEEDFIPFSFGFRLYLL